MTTNFTPGPWHTVDKPNALKTWTVFHGQGEFTFNQVCQADKQADARLIAAAPELLEACLSALHAVDLALCGTPGPHYFKAVKTALKNASASSIEDNLAVNVTEIKEACEAARAKIHAAIAKAGAL